MALKKITTITTSDYVITNADVVEKTFGFYVLSLLIVEATIGLVLTASKLSAEHVWWGLLIAVGLFLLVFIVATVLVICFPKNLFLGKEEHSNPALE